MNKIGKLQQDQVKSAKIDDQLAELESQLMQKLQVLPEGSERERVSGAIRDIHAAQELSRNIPVNVKNAVSKEREVVGAARETEIIEVSPQPSSSGISKVAELAAQSTPYKRGQVIPDYIGDRGLGEGLVTKLHKDINILFAMTDKG